MLTAERLSKVLKYDPESGVWYRRLYNRDQGYREKVLDLVANNGYLVTQIDNKKYLLHRLVFLLEDGVFPIEVDHINRNRLDNRRSNLRKVSRKENANNTSPRVTSLSGVKGIHWNSTSKRWIVQKHNKYLGSFTSLDIAIQIVDSYNQGI